MRYVRSSIEHARIYADQPIISSSVEMAAVLRGLIIVRSSVIHYLYVHSARTFIMKNDITGSKSYFFKRPWTQFQQPFGNLTSQYWIGLEKLHQLSLGNCSVRFDLQLTDGTWLYAEYSKFIVGNVSDKYRLNITGYTGTAGDAMSFHNGQRFSTYDSDNDAYPGNCAALNSGGFWFSHCYNACLTCSGSISFSWQPFQLNACLVSISC